MLERARTFADWLVRPLARLLLTLRIPPDAVTWAGTIAVCVVALVTIPNGWLWQGALLIGVLSLSDTVDGAMARLSGRQRTWGAFLDSSLDRVADGALFGAVLLHVVHRPSWLPMVALAVLVLGQLTSYVKARAESLGGEGGGGPGARADRIVIILLALLLEGVGVPCALAVGLVVLAVLAVITVIIRMRRAKLSFDAGHEA